MTIKIKPNTLFRTPTSIQELEHWIHEVTVKGDETRANMFMLLMFCHNYYATMINVHQNQDKEVIENFADFTRHVANGKAGVNDALDMLSEFADHNKKVTGK